MQRINATRRGYTLWELMAVIACLAVLVVIFMQLFLTSSRLYALQSEALVRFEHIDDVEASFREAVGEGTRIVPQAWGYQSNDTTVVLQRPSHSGEDRYTLLTLLPEKKKLAYGRVVVRNGAREIEYWKTLQAPIEDLEFTYEESAGVRMFYSLARDEDDDRAVQTYEVYAAPQTFVAMGEVQ